MFTGIVAETGVVRDVTADDGGRRLRVGTDRVGDFSEGESVAVSGVCLTVEAHGDDWFEVFTAAETLDVTYLGDLAVGDPVNVERALPADGRLDGHVVQGHVDATTTVTDIESVGEDWRFEFALPDGHAQYVAHKGSIALDGVSLTVASLDDDAGTFEVAVIPATYDATTLGEAAVGDPVHVEVDVLAKYVERLT
jgi:riboflavin synthase